MKDGEGNLLGYVIHGRKSVCYAALAGRALNRILVNVTDGELTVGVVNHHSFTNDNEWTGIGKSIPYVAIAGENEIAAGKITLKNMLTGDQQLISPDEMVEIVRN